MSAFRLASLLRLRAAQQDRAAAALAEETDARLAALRHTTGQREALAEHTFDAGTGAQAWTAAVASRAALSARHTEAMAALTDADERVRGAELAWYEARRSTKALERLEQRHLTVARAEQDRVEQQVLDELAGRTVREENTP